jgi:hypothetical protein
MNGQSLCKKIKAINIWGWREYLIILSPMCPENQARIRDNLFSALAQQQAVAAACGEVIFDDRLDTGVYWPSIRSVLVHRSGELIGHR